MAAFVWGQWARWIVVYLGCCLLFLAVAAPVSPDDGPSQAKYKTTIGVPQSFPPYYPLDEDGNPSGLAVDVRNFVVSSEYRKAYVAWFGKPDPFWTVARVSWTIGGILAVSLAAIFGWHYRSVISLNRALRESEELFRALFENLPLSIHIKDRQGRYLLANKAYMARTGKSLDEIKGKTVFDYFPQDVASTFTALDSEVFDSGQAITRETDLPTSFDGLRQIRVTKFPILSPGGVPEAVGVINVDVTEQKQAEAKLKASQDRLAGILAIAPEAVITVGKDMKIHLFNQGAERIFGYDAEKVIGQPLEILMPEGLREGHRKHIEGFDGSGDTYRLMDQRQEIIGLRKDGTEFPAAASVSKLEVGGEKIFTVMLRNITARKQAEDDLIAATKKAEEASHAKSEFLAAMSHDLRTPLNAILGFADILSHQYFGPISDKYREYARDIQSSGQHLLELVNDILDLSTIEAGKQSLVKEKLPIEEVIAECEKIIGDKARSYGIDLITNVPKNLPFLYADRRATKQILLNLLSNAVKFTPQGGRITLSAKGSKRETVFTVADTGKGIPAEKLPGLTDPFTTGEYDPYLAEKGWGLGLTITKSLVDLHDGTLDIKSKVGKGTTVTVTFPAKAA